MVGEGDAMGGASAIVENMLGSTERRLGVDHPILWKPGSQEGCEVIGLVQRGQRAVEDEMVVAKGASQPRHELAAEDTAEYLDAQKEGTRRADPTGVIRCQPARQPAHNGHAGETASADPSCAVR